MHILITGGAGFIGSNLARYMLKQEETTSVRVIDDLSTGARDNLAGLDVEFVEASILDFDELCRTADGMDSIVHLGAVPSVPRSIANPTASHIANATGTLNVLEAARQVEVEHVVVASSSSVYGANPNLPKNEFDWIRPMSPYAASKAAAESYAYAYQHSYGMKTLVFRFFNVFGPGQSASHAYAAVIPKFLDAALRGQPVDIYGDGLQSRDFTFVETVCSVIAGSVTRKIHSLNPVNLAYGTNTTLLSLLEEVEAQLGGGVQRTHFAPRIGDVRMSQADNARVKELFPEVEPVSLPDGLQATIEWFKEEKLTKRSG